MVAASQVRAGIPAFSRLPMSTQLRAMARLAVDLNDGTWHQHSGDLLSRNQIEGGYRPVVSLDPIGG